jgi:hypothetical protein
LPVQPVCTGTVYVRILGSLVASAKQQDHLSSSYGVIDSISRPDVDTQFPHPIATKPLIAEIAQLYPVDSPINGDPCLCVAELAAPFHEEVFRVPREVMANLVYGPIIVYKRIYFKH